MLCTLNNTIPSRPVLCPAGMSLTPQTCIASLTRTQPTGWLVGDGTGTRIIVWARLILR